MYAILKNDFTTQIMGWKRVKTVEYVVEVTSMRLVSDQIKQNFISLQRRSQKQLTVAEFYALYLCPCQECSVITVVEFKVKKATGSFYDLLFRLGTILEKKVLMLKWWW